jgi:tetratricopeptide (TPR) repeat protein
MKLRHALGTLESWNAMNGKLLLGLLGASARITLMIPFSAAAHADLLPQIDDLTQQIQKSPTNAELYLRRGELRRIHLDWDEAAVDYDKAQALAPSMDAVILARGRLFFDSGWVLSAKACLDRYLSRVPHNAAALVTRAQILTHLQFRLAAAEDYTRAIAFSPEPGPELFIERAQVFSGEGSTHFAEALKSLDEGVQRLGPLVTLQLLAIDLELKQKNFDGALRRLDSVAEKSPRKESWLTRRGEILVQAGRPAEAKRSFHAALAALETLPPTRRNVPAMLDLRRRIDGELQKLASVSDAVAQ